ncbi:hypothetical protein KSX_04260 [Ktedonospora formicarum]|uniref:Uncharacterized protein n=1 Tax=Ktedonospora formicarum TaxID=2778364 RepID=A0A8J3HWR2_9CHLR|nr:hypothetical protein KSX_04260 [Ktedonospora formicarum]
MLRHPLARFVADIQSEDGIVPVAGEARDEIPFLPKEGCLGNRQIAIHVDIGKREGLLECPSLEIQPEQRAMGTITANQPACMHLLMLVISLISLFPYDELKTPHFGESDTRCTSGNTGV